MVWFEVASNPAQKRNYYSVLEWIHMCTFMLDGLKKEDWNIGGSKKLTYDLSVLDFLKVYISRNWFVNLIFAFDFWKIKFEIQVKNRIKKQFCEIEILNIKYQ